MSYLPREKSLDKIGSIGVPIPGGKFSIIDGELIYEGKNVTLGYAEKKKDLAKGDERFGRLATGDMARVDEDGYYYIVGRKKRFLKILGKRVNLDEVEQILKAEYPNLQLACAGTDDQLEIFLEKNRQFDAGQLKEFLSDRIELNQATMKVVWIEHIPVNESGKIQYRKLEEMKYHLN